MYGHIIAQRQHFFERIIHCDSLRDLSVEKWIISHYVHAQSGSGCCDFFSDGAKTCNAQSLAHYLGTGKLGFTFFNCGADALGKRSGP